MQRASWQRCRSRAWGAAGVQAGAGRLQAGVGKVVRWARLCGGCPSPPRCRHGGGSGSGRLATDRTAPEHCAGPAHAPGGETRARERAAPRSASPLKVALRRGTARLMSCSCRSGRWAGQRAMVSPLWCYERPDTPAAPTPDAQPAKPTQGVEDGRTRHGRSLQVQRRMPPPPACASGHVHAACLAVLSSCLTHSGMPARRGVSAALWPECVGFARAASWALCRRPRHVPPFRRRMGRHCCGGGAASTSL